MIKLLLILLLSSSSVWSASLTAHVGCLGSLGVEQACAGDTITCVNTAESSLPLRLSSLQVSYEGVVTDEELEEILHEPTTFILPPGVDSVGPNANMAAVYVIKTNPLDIGIFRIGAIFVGQISYDDGVTWLSWSASYSGIPVTLSDCSIPASFSTPPPPKRKHHHRMHVRRCKP